MAEICYKYKTMSSRPSRFSGDAAFIAHRRSALRVDERALTAFVLPSVDGVWRFAAVSSKRVGGAVERNRARRRLREAFAIAKQSTGQPLSVIIYSKTATLKAPFAELSQTLEKIFTRAVAPR